MKAEQIKSRKSCTRSGIQKWRLNGLFHNEDGPAVIHPNGYQEYWINGQLHRDDGPAIVSQLGRKEWWEHGVLLKVEWPENIDWVELVRKSEEEYD